MYKRILVTGMTLQPGDLIEEGEKLVRKLEEKNFPISAAFWREMDEEKLFRLVVVSPFVGREGPLRTYEYISQAVDELGDSVHFGLGDISVMSPSWSQFRDLQRTIEGAGVNRLDASGAPVTARWQESDVVYLYRWNPDLTSDGLKNAS
ncbi:MAG: hypothetical protein ACRD1O_12480 [Terriglobia bacterium]